MENLLGLDTLDRLTAVVVLAAVAIAVITDKLVWHTRLRKTELRAERWERVALEALKAGAHAGVTAAEVTADIVSAMPDPVRERQERGEM